jgi:hypothetical protein
MRRQLALLLTGDQAHMTFDAAVADFPDWAINRRAPNVTYTPWHLVEHLRITQWDSLRYIQDPTGHVSPDWPTQYWPDPAARTDTAGFRQSCAGFLADLHEMQALALDESVDLFAVLEGTPGHTAFRSIALIGNHNSYHVGEFAAMRQVMASWPPTHK